MRNIVEVLRERLLLQDLTDPEFEKLCSERAYTVYIGFDPTADSLHIGHMVSIMILKHFQLCGHRPIALVGGGTGMIGDPSGKSAERSLLSAEQIRANMEGIRRNLSQFIEFGDGKAMLLNNADWLGAFSFLDFLRDVGKHFRVNEMLTRDSVKRRLESQSGLSYTEFSYSLLQACDFKHLHDHHACDVQAGGSDQWGNIVSGTELIRRTSGGRVFGITTPLLTDAEGRKMGKTEGGAVWLDPNKFSPYEFYQFWVRQEDAVVERFLKMMTLVPIDEIATVMAAHQAAPERRIAQKRLALEVTALAHGADEAQKAKAASEALFGGELRNLSDAELKALFQEVPSVAIPRAELDAGLATADLLVRAGLAPSKKDAKRLLEQGGVYLNNAATAIPQEKRAVTAEDLASETMLILRAGKKKYALVQFG
ncbi:tyrosine--tRNA ligase [bacterium]|nr:tyrosine--tRNA ligase [bacterium]